MLFNDVIELMIFVDSVNDMKDAVKTPSYRTVFANKKSVRQNEFYQAAATGLRPEIMFEVRSIEYNGERQLRYPAGSNGKVYNIIRTYDKDDELTELICSGTVNRS